MCALEGGTRTFRIVLVVGRDQGVRLDQSVEFPTERRDLRRDAGSLVREEGAEFGCIAHERKSAVIPARIPRRGHPDAAFRYPWPWAVSRWVAGETATVEALADSRDAAVA